MTAQLTQFDPQWNAHLNVSEHLQGTQRSNDLHEPAKSAQDYADLILQDPSIDRSFCEQAGKVVFITANFAQPVEGQVTIRGNHCPLNWDVDRFANQQRAQNLYERTFTLYVDRYGMNETLEFKMCHYVDDKLVLWSKGENYRIPLENYGHIAVVKVSDVQF